MPSHESRGEFSIPSRVYRRDDDPPHEVRSGAIAPDVWKGCLTKLRFSSAGAARRWAKEHRKIKPADDRLRTYHCSWCGNWHLTKTPRNRTEDITRSTGDVPGDG